MMFKIKWRDIDPRKKEGKNNRWVFATHEHHPNKGIVCEFPKRQKARNWIRNHINGRWDSRWESVVIVHPNGFEEQYVEPCVQHEYLGDHEAPCVFCGEYRR